MSISFLEKLGLGAAAGTGAWVWPGLKRRVSRKFLYRKFGSAVIILALSVALVSRCTAQNRPQLKRPGDTPQERPAESKKTKKEKGPRAVGILQLSSNGKATLIPIAILIDGKFHDASVYKADPVPMALDSGTVYEAEQTGESQGLFTIRGALHSKSSGSPSPWLGAGSYVLNGAEVAKTSHTAEDKPRGLDDSSDAPPRLKRENESKDGKPAASSQPAAGSSGSGTSSQGSQKPEGTSASDKNADQGTKSKEPAQEKTSSSQSSPGQSASGQSSSGQSSSSQAASNQPSSAQAPQDPQSQGASSEAQSSGQERGSGNYYRPTLRRGKPADSSAPDEDEDKSQAKTDKANSPATSALAPAPVQLVPAISDAGGPDPQSYRFFWKEGEEDERRTQILRMAADEVRAYVNDRAKGVISAKRPVANAGGAKTSAAAHKATTKPVQPVFESIQFRAFDVWKNSQPVMVLSAEAHLPPVPGTATPPLVYDVAIAARTDIYGNLRKLYAGVTDKYHLDVTPRLELIDVVDADGDGRGELLFRETTDAGSGYVIYRATADKLWKMFDSLGED